MTRFARAKGSKASNERLPGKATPWHVMKQQLDTVKAKENSEKPKNAKELLKEKDDPYYWDTVVNKTEWAKLDTDGPSKSVKKNNPGKVEKSSPKKSASKKVSLDNSVSLNDSNDDKSRKRKPEEVEKAAGETENVPKKKKKKKKNNKPANDQVNVVGENKNVPKKKENKLANNGEENVSKKKKNIPAVSSEENSTADKKVDENKEEKKVSNVKLSKRQKRNRKNKIKNDNSNQQDEVSTPITFNVEGNDWNNDIKFGSGDGKSKFKPRNNNDNSKPENKNYPNNYNDKRFNQKVVKQRPAKIRDNLEHKRRKPEPGAQKVIINGMEVEIVLYDGFPVRKDDAERLKELRKKLVMNGIPKPDIDRAMKLERRKAEKALARIRKNVCFHCRKAGHNLSDCPELGREEAATGICFKCGSTEHTHFECKVNKKEEFRFATCFICREQGHIAKQCPDNPNGLYPKGGACSNCGDVTHLKKDCPTLIEQKEGARITLSTIADVDSVETIDGLDNSKKNEVEKKSKKIVKF